MSQTNESPPRGLVASGLGVPEAAGTPRRHSKVTTRCFPRQAPSWQREVERTCGAARRIGISRVGIGLSPGSLRRESSCVRNRRPRGPDTLVAPPMLVTNPASARSLSFSLSVSVRRTERGTMRGGRRSGHPQRKVQWSGGAWKLAHAGAHTGWLSLPAKGHLGDVGRSRRSPASVPLSFSHRGWRVSSRGLTGPALTLKAGRMALESKPDSNNLLWGSRHFRGGRDVFLPAHTHPGSTRSPSDAPPDTWPSNRWGSRRELRWESGKRTFGTS